MRAGHESTSESLLAEVQSVVSSHGGVGRFNFPVPDPRVLCVNEPLTTEERIWRCKIGGPVNWLPDGADLPMRKAIQEAFTRLTGREPEFTFSGWGAKLVESERAVVEDRKRAETSIEARICKYLGDHEVAAVTSPSLELLREALKELYERT
jgi:hypothetical protein